MSKELLEKLIRTYSVNGKQKRNIFGARPATPREIQEYLHENFKNQEINHLSSQKDIKEKGE